MKHLVLVSFLAACNPAAGTGASSGGSSGGAANDTFAWAESYTTDYSHSHIAAAAADASGVVIVGQVTGTAKFGATSLSAVNNSGNAFVAKLDANGNVLWAQIADGDQSAFEAVTVDSAGNIFIAGVTGGTGTLGFTFAGHNVLSDFQGGKIGDSFIAAGGGVVLALDKSGNYKWLNLIETSQVIDAGSITLSGSNVIVAGALDGSAAFAPDQTQVITTCPIEGCVFFASYDGQGNVGFLRIAPSTPARNSSAGNPREVWATSDATGNIFLVIGGFFAATTHASDANQVVINKYDPTGALTWAKSAPMPAGGGPEIVGVGTDASGAVYFGGDEGTGLQFGATTITGNDQFLAKYSATGDVVWAVTDTTSLPFGMRGLAVGTHVYTFGNGDVAGETLPQNVSPMALDAFDVGSGAVTAGPACGEADATGEVVAASGTSVYVAGEGKAPGAFGKATTSNTGFFVARVR